MGEDKDMSSGKRDAAWFVWLGVVLSVLGAVLGFGSLGAPSVVTLGGFVIMFAGLGIWWRCARTLNDR